MSNSIIPESYEPLPRSNTFNDAFAPLYFSLTDAGPSFGMLVMKHHLNSLAICHGTIYMCLMDMACCSAVCHAMGKAAGTPTINMNLNYMAASKQGEWLYTESECQRLTKTMGFAMATVRSDTEIKVSANSVFKLPKNAASGGEITLEDWRIHFSSERT